MIPAGFSPTIIRSTQPSPVLAPAPCLVCQRSQRPISDIRLVSGVLESGGLMTLSRPSQFRGFPCSPDFEDGIRPNFPLSVQNREARCIDAGPPHRV